MHRMCAALIYALCADAAGADHLSPDACLWYFQDVPGVESPVNRCNDTAFLMDIQRAKVMCVRFQKQNGKAYAGHMIAALAGTKDTRMSENQRSEAAYQTGIDGLGLWRTDPSAVPWCNMFCAEGVVAT